MKSALQLWYCHHSMIKHLARSKGVNTTALSRFAMFRDEETLEPHVYFCKLPKDVAERDIMVVDPMLATGGSEIGRAHV